MMDKNSIETYVEEIRQQLISGQAREHGYRPALERLIRSFDDVGATNDPRRSEYGNPDMIFYKKSNHDIILGHAEAKDITIDLDKTVKTEQLRRYAGYNKLFLTNYLDFRFYRNGEEYERVSIGNHSGQTIQFDTTQFTRLVNELNAFLQLPPEPIKSGRSLAFIMGAKCQRIRDNVARYLNEKNEKNQELEKIYKMMKDLLVHDLTKEKFADMYAQTLVYGLFAARYADSTPDNFTRNEARDLVPRSNPFLRKFFDHIAGSDFDTRLAHIVDEMCAVFAVSNVHLIVQQHLHLFEENSTKDPVIHFYEDFLKEYDPQERKKMGAYYTPVPVVRFMVQKVDEILKREFGILKGLASEEKITKDIEVGQDMRHDRRKKFVTTQKLEFHKVQVLDPAVGTATFLNETIWHIYKTFKGQEGRWPAYAEAELLPRLSGFELMMAPYTIAHLKLGMTLQETGVKDLDQRLGVYLTNTLEEGVPQQQDLFGIGLAAVVTEESQKASEIKHERPIMVVMGNPPYSGVSSNETVYANGLVERYKVEPGGLQKLQERKHWLNDDYVKFMAFAEDMIAKNGKGIVAMITNHGYLDNPTFRGMRWHLSQTFDSIYVLDLHGNSKRKEITPDGSKDENVFDIQQGVAIVFAVKTGQKLKDEPARIFHSELYGTRRHKFDKLAAYEQNWQELLLDKHMLYFVNKNIVGQTDYESGIRLSDLFLVYNTGIVTMGDNFIIDNNKQTLADRIKKLISGAYTEQELNQEFGLGKNYAKWVMENYSNVIFDNKKLVPLAYRPFDQRYTYFDNKLVWRPRSNVMQHFLQGDNIGLVTARQCVGDWRYVFITDTVGDFNLTGTAGRFGSGSFFPLYLFHEDETRSPNFKPNELKKFTANLKRNFNPEDIFDYIYATLHSLNYRKKYKEFLALDFPRVPIPKNDFDLHKLADIGHQLRELHLMKSPRTDNLITTFTIIDTNKVEKVTYESTKVWINETQYFGNVPEVAWKFYIGGYQPAQKWLKDRKGYTLSSHDIEYYQKIIKVLEETDKIIHLIDEVMS